jgi:hypothetical protein
MHILESDLLLCPKNDPESLTILRLAKAMDLASIESAQPHGATLSEEVNLEARIAEHEPKRIVIVEIPGPSEERELRDLGYEVIIIDHHQYGDIDRSQPKSSLEQFLELYEVSDEDVKELNFDPVLINGVGAMDRGFFWAVNELDYSNEEKKRIIEHYESLLLELGGEERGRQEAEAEEVFEGREELGKFLYFNARKANTRLRDALSFRIAREYGRPIASIIDMADTLYVQETTEYEELLREFGGFTFGTNCYGKMIEAEEDRQSILEYLKML